MHDGVRPWLIWLADEIPIKRLALLLLNWLVFPSLLSYPLVGNFSLLVQPDLIIPLQDLLSNLGSSLQLSQPWHLTAQLILTVASDLLLPDLNLIHDFGIFLTFNFLQLLQVFYSFILIENEVVLQVLLDPVVVLVLHPSPLVLRLLLGLLNLNNLNRTSDPLLGFWQEGFQVVISLSHWYFEGNNYKQHNS